MHRVPIYDSNLFKFSIKKYPVFSSNNKAKNLIMNINRKKIYFKYNQIP